MNDGKIRIILNRKQAVSLMNLLAIQSESSISKQYNFIKESYGEKDAASEFERDYPSSSVKEMVSIVDKLFLKLDNCLNPDSITIDLT